MFNYDPFYHRSSKLKPGSALEVSKYETKDFNNEDATSNDSEPLVKNAEFEKMDEFNKFKPDIEAFNELPSLEDLFKPFDLDNFDINEDRAPLEPYKDLHTPTAMETYDYEDLDTRPPEVVQTLSWAKAEAEKIIQTAQTQSTELIQNAKNEASEFISELKRKEEKKQEEIQQELNLLREGLEKKSTEADARLKTIEEKELALESEKHELSERQSELDKRLSEIETERIGLEDNFNTRLKELEKAQEEQAAQTEKEAFEKGQSEGLEQGLKEGLENGFNEAKTKFQNDAEGFFKLLEKLEKLYEDLWAANGPMMIKLAINAAERIVNKKLSQDEDLAACAFKASIGYLSQAHKLTVLARPQDIASLEHAKVEQRERLGALVKIEFKADDSLGPGDLIIESDVGRLDATMKHRSNQVMEKLLELFDERYGEKEIKVNGEVAINSLPDQGVSESKTLNLPNAPSGQSLPESSGASEALAENETEQNKEADDGNTVYE